MNFFSTSIHDGATHHAIRLNLWEFLCWKWTCGMGFIYLHDSTHEHMIVRFYVLVIIDMYICIHYIYILWIIPYFMSGNRCRELSLLKLNTCSTSKKRLTTATKMHKQQPIWNDSNLQRQGTTTSAKLDKEWRALIHPCGLLSHTLKAEFNTTKSGRSCLSHPKRRSLKGSAGWKKHSLVDPWCEAPKH